MSAVKIIEYEKVNKRQDERNNRYHKSQLLENGGGQTPYTLTEESLRS